MASDRFLAMTAAEIHRSSTLPERIGWMACHFSPYSTGLSNLPRTLPPDSLLILNDRIPIHGHDPQVIRDQLWDVIDRFGCAGLLLDLQRPENSESAQLVRHLSGSLRCPVAVSEPYARETSGPVFLPPLPHHVPLGEHIAPWNGREIWLELALDAETITVTEDGCAITSLPTILTWETGFDEKALHCHYKVALQETGAEFTLWRTKEDIDALQKEMEQAGIAHGVGIYQEFSYLYK